MTGRTQDLLALSAKYAARPAAEETINDPTVRRHYWRFRSHVPLEDVLADAAFLGGLQALLLGAPALWRALHGGVPWPGSQARRACGANSAIRGRTLDAKCCGMV